MRLFYFLLFFVGMSLSTSAQKVEFKTGLEYNNYIIDLQSRIGQSIAAFNSSVDSGSASYTHSKRELIVKTVDEVLVKMKKLPAYNGNSEFRSASISLFEFYKACAEKEYKELVDLVLGSSQLNDAGKKRLNELMADVTSKEQVFDENFAAAQKKFADANNFTLSSD